MTEQQKLANFVRKGLEAGIIPDWCYFIRKYDDGNINACLLGLASVGAVGIDTVLEINGTAPYSRLTQEVTGLDIALLETAEQKMLDIAFNLTDDEALEQVLQLLENNELN